MTAGCAPFVDNNMIEEIAPVIFWSVSDAGKGKLQISTLVPPLINEKKRLLSLKVDLLKQSDKNFNLIYYRELKAGQLRMLLIDEQLARKGILPIINTLLIDPDISQRLYLVIVRGDFDTYMNNQLDKQPDLDYFLYRMFKHYEQKQQGEMTVVNLHQFKNKLYSSYVDSILPVFKVSNDQFTYDGTAFFNYDKLTGTVKDIDDEIFQLIDNDHYLKLLPLPKKAATLGHVRSNVHFDLNSNYTSLNVSVNLTGRLEEYRGNKNIRIEEQLNELTKEIELYLEEHSIELLNKLKTWKVDPLRVGKHTLTPFGKTLSDKEWHEKWAHMGINVDYRLQIEPLTSVVK